MNSSLLFLYFTIYLNRLLPEVFERSEVAILQLFFFLVESGSQSTPQQWATDRYTPEKNLDPDNASLEKEHHFFGFHG